MRKQTNGKRVRTYRRFETLETRRLLAGDMTNPNNPLDVNDDAIVSAADALAIINYLGRRASGAEAQQASAFSRTGSQIYPDTSGNGEVAASDALRVINALAEGAEVETPASSNDFTTSLEPKDAASSSVDSGIAAVNSVPMSAKFDTGSSPKVELSGTNQTVTVTSPDSGKLRFQGSGLDKTISIKYDLHIKLSGSENRLIFNGANIPDDLFVHVDGSANVVQLSNTQVGDDLIFHGSNGADVLILDSQTKIKDDAIVHGEKGDDSVLVFNASVRDDFIFYGHDGKDLLAVENASVGDDAIVRMGDDNDTVSLKNIAVRDVADIDGDRNTDSLAVDVSTVKARRYNTRDFETTGALANVQALIDAALASIDD